MKLQLLISALLSKQGATLSRDGCLFQIQYLFSGHLWPCLLSIAAPIYSIGILHCQIMAHNSMIYSHFYHDLTIFSISYTWKMMYSTLFCLHTGTTPNLFWGVLITHYSILHHLSTSTYQTLNQILITLLNMVSLYCYFLLFWTLYKLIQAHNAVIFNHFQPHFDHIH